MIILRIIVQYGLYLILFTPLLVYTGFLSPFLTPKVVVFQILVEVVFGAMLFTWLPKRRKHTTGLERIRSPLFSAVSLYLLYALLTAGFGLDVNRSLWGVIERQDGLVLQLHFLVWLLVLMWFYLYDDSVPKRHRARNEADRPSSLPTQRIQRYLKTSFWVSVAAAVTVIYQWLEQRYGLLGLVPEHVQVSSFNRASGVFGNPLFAGNYLMVHFFYGLYWLSVLLSGNSSAPKTALFLRIGKSASVLLGECLLITALLLGQSRGVLLGFAVGVCVALVLMTFTRNVARPLRIGAATASVLLTIALIVLWQFRESPVAKNIPLLTRLSQTSFEEATILARFIAWNSAINAFKDHPLLGWGENNVYYGLNKYYNPELARFDPYSTEWYDKSHNAYLDSLSEKGLVGAVLFLIIFLAAVKSLRVMEDKRLAVAITGALVGHLVAIFFAFNIFGSFFGLFLFLAVLVLSDAEKKLEQRKENRIGKNSDNKITRLVAVSVRPAVVIVLFLLVGCMYVSIATGKACIRYQDARLLFAQNPEWGLNAYRIAFQSYSPYREREQLYCAARITESVLNKRMTGNADAHIREAFDLGEGAARAFPRDASILMSLAEMCNNLGIYRDKNFLALAEHYGQQALALTPRRQQAAFLLGGTYILLNKTAEAVELNRSLVRDCPNLSQAHWFLGLSLVADGKPDEAKQEIKKAFALGYRFRGSGEENVVKNLFGERDYIELMKTI